MSEENNNVETTNNTSKENNRPPRKLKLFINIDDSTKFKDRIFTHICKAKNQFPRKSDYNFTHLVKKISENNKELSENILESIKIKELFGNKLNNWDAG